jgi:hypothetical protein
MNRKVLVIIVAFFAVVISASSIAPILASETYTEIFAGGQSNALEVPGQPKFGVMVATYDRSSDHGARDRIWISIFTPDETGYMPVAVLSDGRNEVFPEVFKGTGLDLIFRTVKPWTIQVSRISKLVIAYWTKPIECVVPLPLRGFYGGIESWTLPPGMLILKGYGEVISGSSGPLTPPSGYKISNEFNDYAAKGTFFCPTWRFCGPVSEKATIYAHTVTTLEAPPPP